jgi:hypothetical protein
MKLKPWLLFDLAVIAFFAYFVYEARDWRPQARLYPWAIGVPMLVLAVFHLVWELKWAGVKPVTQPSATPVDFTFTRGVDPALARRRTLLIFSWILGFFAGIWLFGFKTAVPAFVFLYLKFQSREEWGLSLALTGAAWLVFWGLFIRLLGLPFPEGAILSWLGLS